MNMIDEWEELDSGEADWARGYFQWPHLVKVSCGRWRYFGPDYPVLKFDSVKKVWYRNPDYLEEIGK